jgi:X-X-X-Leu-X-X-Gly heptad repeat protein
LTGRTRVRHKYRQRERNFKKERINVYLIKYTHKDKKNAGLITMSLQVKKEHTKRHTRKLRKGTQELRKGTQELRKGTQELRKGTQDSEKTGKHFELHSREKKLINLYICALKGANIQQTKALIYIKGANMQLHW